LLFAWLVYSVYKDISAQKDLPEYLHYISNSIDITAFLLLLFVFALMLIQWMFEAAKWQLLLNQHIKLTIAKAMMMIFTGISFSIATPNRFGEFIGRILHLPKDLRLQATGYTFIGNFAQLLVTSVAGSIGLVFLCSNPIHGNLAQYKSFIFGLTVVSPILSILGLVVYFRAGLFFSWVSKIKFLFRWQDKLMQLSELSISLLIKVLIWSVLRYAIFILQYWLIFSIIGLEVTLQQTATAVSVVLLVLSIIPTISLVELGLRWQISILVFAPVTANVFGLTMGVTLIWLLNMIIPAGIGSLMMLSYRYSEK
jgi:hypothetical protein